MVSGVGSGVAVKEFAFGGFVLIPALMRLDFEEQTVPLSHSAFQTLLVLVENRDRVVTKRELLEKVWAGTAVEENNLNQCISALRKTFGDSRKEARFIATIPGAGYRFVIEVLERERTPDDDAITEAAVLPAQVPVGFFRRHGLALAIAVCAVLGAAVGWNAISRSETAVLVLPLESYGAAGGDSDYIRKGVGIEIEAALARTPGLHVAAGVPESVLKTEDVMEVARKVNARAVLRGQVRESAGLLTFTFELVNPETKRILWSDQFTEKRDDVAAAESRVVAGVFKTIQPGRSAPEAHKVNAAAHDLYLRGRVVASTRAIVDLERAVALFEKAVEIDPSYADAYTGIADACGIWAANSPAPPGVLEKARAAAKKAVELDGGSAPAHAALGLVEYADWNWEEARRELQTALRLNPYYSITHHRLALLHYVFNNYREAEAELKKAQELNPYFAAHTFALAELYVGARRFDDVLKVSRQLSENPPDSSYPHYLAMQAYRGKGDRAGALKEIRRAAQLETSPESALHAMLAIAEGRVADARKEIAEHGTQDMFWTLVYAQLGDRERMLGVLRHLMDNRDVVVLAIKDEPMFDAYRGDAEFRELVAKLGLPR
jgi:adenylate cyclase